MLKKYFLTLLAAVFLPQLILADAQKISVKSRYPQAYAWYRDLATKYPLANLSSIEFCISDHHHAGSNEIFWPEQNLKIINQYYNSSAITPEIDLLIKEDEYLLLHEACHVNNSHVTKGGLALAGATTASAGLTLGLAAQACAGAISTTAAAASGILGNAALAASVYAYARSQEQQADEFANQNASQDVLQVGIAWHQNNHDELQIPTSASTLKQIYTEVSTDAAHPSPQSRMNAAKTAHADRFENSTQPTLATAQ